MNLLFICSRNKWRSRTAEEIFKNNGRHLVKSAGTSASARIRINQKLLDWADVIFVMEQEHKRRIVRDFYLEDVGKIEILDIPDEYPFMSEELIAILKASLQSYFADD